MKEPDGRSSRGGKGVSSTAPNTGHNQGNILVFESDGGCMHECKGCRNHSQASLLSKLDRPMAKACSAHIG